ncbi:MAG TPA: ribonuclease HII [Pseudogracilibacillus sp.]|nr:ribonuclease HII [Pseudogracilibacillus sp.]
MKKQSIASLKQLFQNNVLDEKYVNELRIDERKGVQQLIAQYDKQVAKEAEQVQLYQQKKTFERQFCSGENALIAGVDEAGRGPLAGPVVAAAVILPMSCNLFALTDSKQLTEKMRNDFFEEIKKIAISYHISVIDNEQIDKINILEATKLAMIEALNGLQPQPQIGLIDAVPLKGLSFPTKEIIKGDDKSIAIAAASVLAKVTRDRLMEDIALTYPQYGFEYHKGYGTKQHLDALNQYGPSPVHRLSFTPVKPN